MRRTADVLAATLCATVVLLGVVSLVVPFPVGGLCAAAFGWLAVSIGRTLWRRRPM